MAWDHLSINKPHLVYIILGGFTSIFMLCSSVIKERLYIGEATVATICGIIFGPHAANLINPETWGNVDQITLEFSRIVLVVQCFAVGVELPREYMEKHWRSVVFLLVPVMTFGWLMTSLFIWAVFNDRLNWLDSLVCAACVTATDPVLASSVVGKGKFAKRVPKHLRDLLSAESGCNDGMAFPFIYLGIYLVRYNLNAGEVTFHWFCFTILYECVFGAVYGVMVGYIARRAIRLAHEKDLIDRESFLVFYFVLALFCAGSGSLLGMDDLLVGFACGVGFSNDGWFQEKTEESHVSNVIDLLINLAFFVYFGTIIPWNLYASNFIGTSPWKLVVIALLVLFFRRIPIMLLLKPVIPDIKTWREALFAGHFGPIGVGALFVAILARAEFESDSTTPLANLPPKSFQHSNIIELIWPITTFLVMVSILVHGSSVAVFTLGRHINTLTFTMSYTQANEGMSWMERLPRIQSRSKSSMSLQKTAESSQEDLEKDAAYAGGVSIPRALLRRQKEDDNPSRSTSRAPAKRRPSRWDAGIGPGGHVEESAITPWSGRKTQSPTAGDPEKVDSDSTAVSSDESPVKEKDDDDSSKERYHEAQEAQAIEEDGEVVVEDEDGEVVDTFEDPDADKEEKSTGHDAKIRREAKERVKESHSKERAPKIDWTHPEPSTSDVPKSPSDKLPERTTSNSRRGTVDKLRKLSTWKSLVPGQGDKKLPISPPEPEPAQDEPQRKQVPARAFKFGNTVIVEDEDGEVIKKYDIPQKQRPRGESRPSYMDPEWSRQQLQRVAKWAGVPAQEAGEQNGAGEESSGGRRKSNAQAQDVDDDRIRFTLQGTTRRMSKNDFIKQILEMDPRNRTEAMEESDAPEGVKRQVRSEVAADQARQLEADQDYFSRPRATNQALQDQAAEEGEGEWNPQSSAYTPATTATPGGDNALRKVDSATDQAIPTHSIAEDVRAASSFSGGETAAQRRRRMTSSQPRRIAEESDDDGSERVRPQRRQEERKPAERESRSPRNKLKGKRASDEQEETAAERRRREAALGVSKEDSDDDEDLSAPRQPKGQPGIRFADQPPAAESKPRFGNVRWGADTGR